MTEENKLIPGAALIYERDDRGLIYARYRDPPHKTKPRWVIGNSQPERTYYPFKYNEWLNLVRLAHSNPSLKTQLDKVLDLYYLLKEEQ